MISPFDSPLHASLFGDMELSTILGDDAFVARMIEAEAALARACDTAGVVPKGAGKEITIALAEVDIPTADLGPGLASAGVPVPELVKLLKAQLGDAGNALHWGATSQDIVDLATVLQWREAIAALRGRLVDLIDALTEQSTIFAQTPMAARTRSQTAVPISFGLRIATWAQPLIHAEQSLSNVETALLRTQFGGAAGSLSALGPDGTAVANALADELNLTAAPVWHTDRSAILGLGQWLITIGAALQKMARDLVIMGRSEITEARAGTGGGSSTMPHKSNPVTAEAIITLTDYAALLQPGLTRAASPLEERDGAAWAVEWFVLPQLGTAIGAALRHAQALAMSIEAKPEPMQAQLQAHGGATLSEAASFALSEHMPRSDAQALIKTLLPRALQNGTTLAQELAADPRSASLGDWETLLDPATTLKSAEDMRQRILAQRDKA